MESRKGTDPKSNTDTQSSLKNQLIETLLPLCPIVPWMQDTILKVRQCKLPDTYFEISGLARKITYQLIKNQPELFEKNHVALPHLINQFFDHITITDISHLPLDQVAKKLFDDEVAKQASPKQSMR